MTTRTSCRQEATSATRGQADIATAELRTNHNIRAREVRVISDRNENLGVMSIGMALGMAEERGVDLVEVSPAARPPVCRMMDFGKFQYERQRRDRRARKQQKTVEVKEIQLRPKTDMHHLGFKVRDARRWIEKGMKVKVRVKFRGREREYPEIARNRLRGIAEELQDVAVVELHPGMEGNNMLMVLAPIADRSGR